MKNKAKATGKNSAPSASRASADDARADTRQDTDFQRRRFDWAAGVLERLGLTERVNAAGTLLELNAIVFDDKSSAVEMEILNALHSEKREAHFVGLNAKQLKHILRNTHTAREERRSIDGEAAAAITSATLA